MHTSDTGDRSDTVAFDSDDVLGFVLVRTYHTVARRFQEELAPAGLTPIQFGILFQINANPELSQAQVARRVLVTPQSLGEMINVLIRRGLVERAAERGRGHRATLSLTASGRRALRKAMPAVRELSVPEAMGLTDSEYEDLRVLLLKVLSYHHAI